MKIPRNIPVYPMRTVVTLTGMAAHRIRYVESKYGALAPQRNEVGCRLYSQEQVDLIKTIEGLLEKGLDLPAVLHLVHEEHTIASISRQGS
jgi:DNA-binding transcriptional MerR regulator